MQRKIQWRVGCSGFSYGDWKGVFYPAKLPSRQWLSYYSERFDTLEANSTFYHIPRPATLKGWMEQTPDNFVFSIKVPRLITHFKKMVDTHQPLMEFYDLIVTGLQHKLGCLLFQFPPSFSFTEERLGLLVEQLDPAFSNVVEFRHRSWWNDAVYETLRAAGIIFCGISHPLLPDDVPEGFPTQYFRFHGVPELYRSTYPDAYLDNIISRLQLQKDTRLAYLYFNNTMAAAAIPNLEHVQEKLSLS